MDEKQSSPEEQAVSEESPAQEEGTNGAQALYEHLRARTIQSQVTAKKQLLLQPPEGVGKEEMSALLAKLGTEEMPVELQNIADIQGKKDTYYYEATLMTRHYAELDTMIQEKDLLYTIASITRSDCKLYPRPTQFSKLEDTPFRFTRDELLGAAARMTFEKEYEDIGVVQASNGAQAFYSSKYLSERYARALLESIEVEEYENP